MEELDELIRKKRKIEVQIRDLKRQGNISIEVGMVRFRKREDKEVKRKMLYVIDIEGKNSERHHYLRDSDGNLTTRVSVPYICRNVVLQSNDVEDLLDKLDRAISDLHELEREIKEKYADVHK